MQVLLLFVLSLSFFTPLNSLFTKTGQLGARLVRGSQKILKKVHFQNLNNKLNNKLNLTPEKVAFFLNSSENGIVEIGYSFSEKAPEKFKVISDKLPETIEFSQLPSLVKYIEGSSVKSHIFVTEELVFNNSNQIKMLKDKFGQISVVTENGEDFLIDFTSLNGKEILTTKINVGLEIEINQKIPLDDVIATLKQSINQSDLKLISLIDKSNFNKELMNIDEVAKKSSLSYYSFDDVKRQNIKVIFSELKNKNVIIVGHVEGKEFLVEGIEDNSLVRYKIEELENLAKENDIGLILLGCGTSDVSTVTGVKSTIYLGETAQNLIEALKKNNYYDFLSELGSHTNPLVTRINTIDEINHIGTIQIEQQRQIVGAIVDTSVIAGKNRLNIHIKRLADQQRFERNVVISIFLSVFFTFNFLMFRKAAWDEFARTFNIIPSNLAPDFHSRVYKPIRLIFFFPYLQVYGLRKALLCVTLGFIGLYAAMIYFGLFLNLFMKVDFSNIDLKGLYKIDEQIWNEFVRILSKWWNKKND